MQKIEESNRMGKTRELFEKIRDRMGTFHAKMGTSRTEEAKNLTEELYKIYLYDPDNHDGMIMNLEPDIMESEVKWALVKSLQIKLVEVMQFQLNCFKS